MSEHRVHITFRIDMIYDCVGLKWIRHFLIISF
jgi:hypothetical protein